MEKFDLKELKEARFRLIDKIDEIAKSIEVTNNAEKTGEEIIEKLDTYESIYLFFLMTIVKRTDPFTGALLSALTGLKINNQTEMLKYLTKTLKTEEVIALVDVFCNKK